MGLSLNSENYFPLLLLITIISPIEPKRDYYFLLESCEATSGDPKNCDVNCTLTKRDGLFGVTGYMNVITGVDTGGLNVHLQAKPINSKKYYTFINATIPNTCKYLKSNDRSNIVSIGFDELIKSGKVPTCPVEVGTFYIKDYHISPEYFPPVMPEADWRAKGTIFGHRDGKRQQCASFLITGKVIAKKNSFWKLK